MIVKVAARVTSFPLHPATFMTPLLEIHPTHPQPRLIRRAVELIQTGGIVVYPTDSCYALGCRIGDKEAMERIRALRGIDEAHNLTLMCRDLGEVATYAMVDNVAFRLMRTCMPGPYTFILCATREVPRRLQTPKRKTIGVRVPDHPIAAALLMGLGEPLLSSTLILPSSDMPLTDPIEMAEVLDRRVELVIDGGSCGWQPTTIIDFVNGTPTVIREGKGAVESFLR